MLKKIEYICVFLSGGIIYSFIEVAWRGYTHWSMTIAGGICFISSAASVPVAAPVAMPTRTSTPI